MSTRTILSTSRMVFLAMAISGRLAWVRVKELVPADAGVLIIDEHGTPHCGLCEILGGRSMKESWLLFERDVTRESMCDFLEAIRDTPSDVSVLNLVINSRGGVYSAALAMANLLRHQAFRLKTYNLGRVDSAALLLFAAGSERFAVFGSGFYLHAISARLDGIYSAVRLRDEIRRLSAETGSMCGFLERQTGVSHKVWREMMSDDGCELTCSRARRLGLVTHCSRGIAFPSAKDMVRI